MAEFYAFHQNNSGGNFVINDKVANYVIVEATGVLDAQYRAENIGLYFDGVENGLDCSCCGDRWSRPYGLGDPEPMIYDQPLEEAKAIFSEPGDPYAYVYYMDGTVSKHVTKGKGKKEKK
jgi:hypothetical protein